MSRKFRVIRDVTKLECPWLDHPFNKGDVVYSYTGQTFGVVGPNGKAVVRYPDLLPFNEIPYDAIEEMN